MRHSEKIDHDDLCFHDAVFSLMAEVFPSDQTVKVLPASHASFLFIIYLSFNSVTSIGVCLFAAVIFTFYFYFFLSAVYFCIARSLYFT